MEQHSYFTDDLFRFLKELRLHNERDWFLRNKERYETAVRGPFISFIGDLGTPLKKINPHMIADPRPVGGSMMRIYRDIRFSRDKSPYKTSIAAHFWHSQGKEGVTPAYYLHLEPGQSMIGAGIWRPEAGALKKIRDAIVADSKAWQGYICGAVLLNLRMAGESLKRPPAGYDPKHPLIEDIKPRISRRVQGLMIGKSAARIS